ncbi:hypothetical protein SLEP1_g58598 [Rubroshorea leprosula]|uniref:Uncharacterized protein n=1 Tax=Rubroshorea leprosula TaxID=152421 RepID=A0AAV5MUD0_9ROSI|nr:hypothetical protein SLEP1_g58598 [Rubroshorea leprosula]
MCTGVSNPDLRNVKEEPIQGERVQHRLDIAMSSMGEVYYPRKLVKIKRGNWWRSNRYSSHGFSSNPFKPHHTSQTQKQLGFPIKMGRSQRRHGRLGHLHSYSLGLDPCQGP